jgi:sec-independent protein translocase protein TatA
MMFEPSWEKLLIVLVLALIVLGPRKLPEVGRSLGRGIREFKDGVSGNDSGDENKSQPMAALAATQPVPARVTADRAATPAD